MNEKQNSDLLKEALLQLATEPLGSVKTRLDCLSQEGLKAWEIDIIKVINRPRTASINEVFRYFFDIIPETERNDFTNKVLKPIVLAQANLPADQRNGDFYSYLYISSREKHWEIQTNGESGWLPRILTGLSVKELSLILNRASPAELALLLTYFNEHQALEKLSAEIFILFLQEKLSLDELKKLKLSKMAECSEPIWAALGDWFNDCAAAVKPPEGFWEFVEQQNLLEINGFVDWLAIKNENEKSKLEFSTYCSKDNNTLDDKILYDFLMPLMDKDNREGSNGIRLRSYSIQDQMLAYGMLAIYIGTLSTKYNENNIKIRHSREIQQNYIIATPFLGALYKARVFPEYIIRILTTNLKLPEENIKNYVTIALDIPQLTPEPPPISSVASPPKRVRLIEKGYEETNGLSEKEDDAAMQIAVQASLDEETYSYSEGTYSNSHAPPVAQSAQQAPFQFNYLTVILVSSLLSLTLILGLCLSPVLAPLWLIPIVTIAGTIVGALLGYLINYIIRQLTSSSPPNNAQDVDRGNYYSGEPTEQTKSQHNTALYSNQSNLLENQKITNTPPTHHHFQ